MMDYIKTLRLCIKWFQELEGNYLLEQENHKDLLETAEKKCIDMDHKYGVGSIFNWYSFNLVGQGHGCCEYQSW
ncbi:hypothetical protein RHGRI_017457 [Rhododendron griersonianum]|uniref:Uncharacterized protein n=1 Tax=Rhododendron griersonianum TaxID=479676 RepID=A0AAV6JXU5_9ERIC|nr:hypothetical protein RHGRI_017457 [Rhododendron griersonianum]